LTARRTLTPTDQFWEFFVRKVFVVVAFCAAAVTLGGAQASAQVLPPPWTPKAEPIGASTGVGQVVDVWAGLKGLLGLAGR
jgi:limonene-1,2-epoxide hydrolase